MSTSKHRVLLLPADAPASREPVAALTHGQPAGKFRNLRDFRQKIAGPQTEAPSDPVNRTLRRRISISLRLIGRLRRIGMLLRLSAPPAMAASACPQAMSPGSLRRCPEYRYASHRDGLGQNLNRQVRPDQGFTGDVARSWFTQYAPRKEHARFPGAKHSPCR